MAEKQRKTRILSVDWDTLTARVAERTPGSNVIHLRTIGPDELAKRNADEIESYLLANPPSGVCW